MTPEMKAKIDRIPPIYREIYEERAAIREYEGILPREQAEIMAYGDVQRMIARAMEVGR